MQYSKIVIDGYELEYQPSTYNDETFDSREYKRSINGTLVQLPGVIKKKIRFSGICEENQLSELETKYQANNSVDIQDPRGNTWTAYITNLRKIYSDKVRAEYEIELEEV